MEIGLLIRNIGVKMVQGDLAGRVSSICYDSRRCEKDSLFVAIAGLAQDGHCYIEDALLRGARYVVHEKGYQAPPGITAIEVADSRLSLGILARNYFRDPSLRLRLLGVTGTNGKTTVTYLLEAILQAAGFQTGVIGTVNYRFQGRIFPAPNTTPESYEFQRILAEMLEAGVEWVITEVSSHALDLRRVDECSFDLGIFTNLSQDHLDYHGTMEAYYQAKQRLFGEVIPGGQKAKTARMIVNIDDPWGRRLIEEVPLKYCSYGLGRGAEYTAKRFRFSQQGIEATIETPRGELEIRSPMLGKHNLENILAAVAAAEASSIPLDRVKAGIEGLAGVPGRLERVSNEGEIDVFVDYAHTDDALSKVLANLSELKTGRIITVFGCGGNRDRGKRPKMGETAVRFSDLTVITSDNPRFEDPEEIIAEIVKGIDPATAQRIPLPVTPADWQGKAYAVEADRRKAIAGAIGAAAPGDLVLIAGKGHEDYQLIRSERLRFDDREVARESLDSRYREVACSTASGRTPEASPVLSVQEILAACQGSLLSGDNTGVFAGVSTDSRTIAPGNLFIPLKGERFDGHDFVEAVLKQGARGFLWQRDRDCGELIRQEGAIVIGVPDTLKALGDIARFWRRRHRARVVAITGSSGKSTAKEMTAQILNRIKKTLKTEGNFNNLIGLPLTLFRLQSHHEVAVVELGMNVRGEISRLTKIAEPEIGLITSVGPAHLENLKSLEAIREEKGDLFRNMASGGLAVINREDEAIRIIERSWPGRRLTFGFGRDKDVGATEIRGGENRVGISFTLWIEERPFPVVMPVSGRHNVLNALGAAACAWACGASPEDIALGLANFQPLKGRMTIRPLGRKVFLIDDAYNANPDSMGEALKTLAGLKGAGKAVAILGDMLELGNQAAAYHEQIGLLAAETKVDVLFLKGEFKRTVAAGAIGGGIPFERIRFFEEPGEVVESLRRLVEGESWILVKGSRKMRLETVVEALERAFASEGQPAAGGPGKGPAEI